MSNVINRTRVEVSTKLSTVVTESYQCSWCKRMQAATYVPNEWGEPPSDVFTGTVTCLPDAAGEDVAQGGWDYSICESCAIKVRKAYDETLDDVMGGMRMLDGYICGLCGGRRRWDEQPEISGGDSWPKQFRLEDIEPPHEVYAVDICRACAMILTVDPERP